MTYSIFKSKISPEKDKYIFLINHATDHIWYINLSDKRPKVYYSTRNNIAPWTLLRKISNEEFIEHFAVIYKMVHFMMGK